MSESGNPRQAAEGRLARFLADAATADDLARLPGDLADPEHGDHAGLLLAIDRLLPLALSADRAAFAAEVSERLAATPASRQRFARGVLRSVRRRQRTAGWAWPVIAAAAALLLAWWLIPIRADAPLLPSTGVRDERGMALRPGAVIDATTARALLCSDGTLLALTAGTRIALEGGSESGGW